MRLQWLDQVQNIVVEHEMQQMKRTCPPHTHTYRLSSLSQHKTPTPIVHNAVWSMSDSANRPKSFVIRLAFTQRRSVAKSVGCFQRHLFVYLFVNTITSEIVNIGWWNLGVGALYKNIGRVRMWVIAPWVRTPRNVALGYDVGKISAGCLVISFVYITQWQKDFGNYS